MGKVSSENGPTGDPSLGRRSGREIRERYGPWEDPLVEVRELGGPIRSSPADPGDTLKPPWVSEEAEGWHW